MSLLRSFGTFLYEQLFETPQWTPSSQTLLRGRTGIVTGGNTGIGFEAAVKLASLNPKLLILAVRNVSKGEAAKVELVKHTGLSADHVEVWELDLASFDSVKNFAARANKLDRLDILLENAGIQYINWKETDDHFEQTLQVNAIATGLLGVLLLPLLAKTATLPLEGGQEEYTPHLTIVGSEAHAFTSYTPVPSGTSLLGDLTDPNSANAKMRYQFSKLVSVFITRQIAALPSAKGVVVNMVNPGICQTGLSKDMPLFARIKPLIAKLARTAECGARNLAWACETNTPPGAYVSVTSVRNTSAYSRCAEGIKLESELWAELVEEWVKVESGVRSIVA